MSSSPSSSSAPRPPRSASGSKASRDDSTERENDDLLSDYTSETSFFDDVGSPSMIAAANSREEWSYNCYKSEGKVHIFGEWISKTKSTRMMVIGPDWPCVLMTYIAIVVPSVFVYLYIVHDLAEEIIFFILFGLCIFGLTTVFVADPGLVRKYHHARDRNWTYCDPCESFRPPHTVHCSSCQVCVASYDVSHCPIPASRSFPFKTLLTFNLAFFHPYLQYLQHHCPWTGKCVGAGNILWFRIFVFTLLLLILFYICLASLDAVGVY